MRDIGGSSYAPRQVGVDSLVSLRDMFAVIAQYTRDSALAGSGRASPAGSTDRTLCRQQAERERRRAEQQQTAKKCRHLFG
ncbi:hypothetical protein [Kitasatospora viridis]|uniref:hypothetical protein n=2 Tax=Kitasatospora viridis TaxID=281105 RepID=UPI0011A24CD8|nr:hypothetical protein [Kitasatospora viridis]